MWLTHVVSRYPAVGFHRAGGLRASGQGFGCDLAGAEGAGANAHVRVRIINAFIHHVHAVLGRSIGKARDIWPGRRLRQDIRPWRHELDDRIAGEPSERRDDNIYRHAAVAELRLGEGSEAVV